MIQICPAILTDDKDIFVSQLKSYSALNLQVDIDVNVDSDEFDGRRTVDLNFALAQLHALPTCQFAIHLMVSTPISFVEQALQYDSLLGLRRIFLHVESDWREASELIRQKNPQLLGLAIKAETVLADNFAYNDFQDIQLMTIETGKQGNPFLPEVLEKSLQLREFGYRGLISVDGSVNDETAKLIASYPIDRVSVGSFFQKAQPAEQLKKLQAIFS